VVSMRKLTKKILLKITEIDMSVWILLDSYSQEGVYEQNRILGVYGNLSFAVKHLTILVKQNDNDEISYLIEEHTLQGD